MISYDTMVKEYGYDPDEKLDEPTDDEIDELGREWGADWLSDELPDEDEDHLDDGVYYNPNGEDDEDLPY